MYISVEHYVVLVVGCECIPAVLSKLQQLCKYSGHHTSSSAIELKSWGVGQKVAVI